MLRLHWMQLNGKPLAVEYQVTDGDGVYAYLGGMSCEMGGNSPGQIIQVAILKHCIEQRKRLFDFLRGDEAYQAHWAVQERKCYDLRVVPQHQTARLRHQLWLAGGTVKHWVRASLHVAGLC